MKNRSKNIILTGFMGTGKTAVGRELARMLNMRLVDVDAEIEAEEKMKISEIFSRFGEDRFRDIETKMIRKIAQEEGLIISTGGGAVLRQENMDILQNSGIVFCLAAAPETILARTSKNSDRPLLQVSDPLGKIVELLNYRKPFYERAGTMIETDTKTPFEIAEEIAEACGCRR